MDDVAIVRAEDRLMSGDWRDMTVGEILADPEVFRGLVVSVARNADAVRGLLNWVEGWWA
jgi:hypothetical protein